MPGDWCGVTYRAYLDFVLARRDLRYLTVDTDYGCGVVRKAKPRAKGLFDRAARAAGGARRRLVKAWRALGDDHRAAWRLFAANRAALLNLITVAAFRAGAPRPRASSSEAVGQTRTPRHSGESRNPEQPVLR